MVSIVQLCNLTGRFIAQEIMLNVVANEPAERRRSAGEAAENSAARRMVYAKKFSIGIEKCKCKV